MGSTIVNFEKNEETFQSLKKINIVLLAVIILLGGGYAASMFWLQVNSSYQDRIFQTIVDKTIADSMSDKEKITTIVELTHRLMGPPRKTLLLPPEEGRGFKDLQLRSADVALIGGYACYMHAQVAGMLLQKAGFEFRFFSMEKDGKSHHAGEVVYEGRYIAIDPLFNQMFVKPDGGYASVEEVHENWLYYKHQVGNKLLFKDYDKPRYYPTDFYREFYDYTPTHNRVEPKKNLTTMVLGFKDNQNMDTQMQLNRYLYWQVKLTKNYVLILIIFTMNITAYMFCKKSFC